MKKFLFLIIIAASIVSCQKEIDVDLNEANPVVVIEGNFTAEDSTVRVKVSLTSNYFGADPFPDINTAVITITDAQGTVTSVPNVGNGSYVLANYIPVYDTEYTMNVAYNGTTYTSSSILPAPVPLDDFDFMYFNFFGEEGYVANLTFQDPANVENYYLVVLTQNGDTLDKIGDIILHDDQLTDGNNIERPLFGPDYFEVDDTIGMEMRSVDKRVYDYYNEIISIASPSGNSAAPANPDAYWTNKALGYFNAYSNSRKESIVVE